MAKQQRFRTKWFDILKCFDTKFKIAMYKTYDVINFGFETMSKNKWQRQPRRFEKTNKQKKQNRTSRKKKTWSLEKSSLNIWKTDYSRGLESFPDKWKKRK